MITDGTITENFEHENRKWVREQEGAFITWTSPFFKHQYHFDGRWYYRANLSDKEEACDIPLVEELYQKK